MFELKVQVVRPQKARTTKVCSDCSNAAFGSGGVFCLILRDQVWDEKEAEDCQCYQP